MKDILHRLSKTLWVEETIHRINFCCLSHEISLSLGQFPLIIDSLLSLHPSHVRTNNFLCLDFFLVDAVKERFIDSFDMLLHRRQLIPITSLLLPLIHILRPCLLQILQLLLCLLGPLLSFRLLPFLGCIFCIKWSVEEGTVGGE